MKLPLVLFAAALQAQTLISIDAGSASENACTGSKWGSAQQASMANQAAPFNTLRYGPSFTCTIPEPLGTCQVTLQFLENRPAIATATVPASGPGLRIFTASVNGVSTPPLDLFMLAGAQTPYTAPPITVPVVDGLLHLGFTALPGKGNASVSGIQPSCTPSPATPAVKPKFITESFGVDHDSLVSLTLSKTPDPDSGMFIYFDNNFVGEDRVVFKRPEASRQLQLELSPGHYPGVVSVAYWSLEQGGN